MTDKEQIKELEKIIDRTYHPSVLAADVYNAGYHKTIWHKVAEGDLPKNANYVLVAYHYYSLVSYAVACYNGQLSNINNNFRKWSTTDDYFKYDEDAIAWAELPSYKE